MMRTLPCTFVVYCYRRMIIKFMNQSRDKSTPLRSDYFTLLKEKIFHSLYRYSVDAQYCLSSKYKIYQELLKLQPPSRRGRSNVRILNIWVLKL